MSCPIQTAVARFLIERPSAAARRIVVAFSGGVDSSVLLHAITALPDIEPSRLYAVHVDHGLHSSSADWAAHCRRFAVERAVAAHTQRVEVTGIAEHGPEGAARRARYAAFASLLQPGDLLLTAHHADDQAETLLLRALRSAGLDGMAAMRPLRALGDAHLGRPLLEVARAEILDYARRHQLQWIEDPSNLDERLDRNFLRQQVLPLIEKRWPQARRALMQTARHLRAAESAARAELDRRLAEASSGDRASIRIDKLSNYAPEESATLLRHWLLAIELPPPPPRVLDDLLRQLHYADADRSIHVRWPGVELRRYRSALYALRPQPAIATILDSEWLLPEPLTLADGRVLRIEGETPRRTFRVRARSGGEVLTIAANRPRREVRLLFQEQGIPPWQRERLPYLYDGDKLIAVGADLLDHDFRQWLQTHSARLVFVDT